jgi:hypothetical protein
VSQQHDAVIQKGDKQRNIALGKSDAAFGITLITPPGFTALAWWSLIDGVWLHVVFSLYHVRSKL